MNSYMNPLSKSGVLLIAHNLPHIINSTKKHDSPKQQRRNGKYVNKFLPNKIIMDKSAESLPRYCLLAYNLRKKLIRVRG